MRKAISTAVLVVVLSGCATVEHPSLGRLYSRAAQHHGPERNPIILIPGILGSRLVDARTGVVVWGVAAGRAPDPDSAEGARMAALPMREGARLSDLKDTIVPDGALDTLNINLLFLPVRIHAYYNLLRVLGIGGYRDEDLARSGSVDYGEGHFTCFQFAYDFRRDNVENAGLLDQFIQEKREYVRSEYKKRFGIDDADVKFDIVAHSMGGLIARYYLRYGSADLPEDGSLPQITWAGARHVEKLIMVGTPNSGSVKAIEQLAKGFDAGAFLPQYGAAIVGTMPSVYQLLPDPKLDTVIWANSAEDELVDIFDPAVWRSMEWGLASPMEDKVLEKLLPEVSDRASRRHIALEHQKKCLIRAKRFREALKVKTMPPATSLYLFAGDAISTDAVAAIEPEGGTVKIIQKAPGDGTVTRSSALMDQRLESHWVPELQTPVTWSGTMFLFADHLGMTKDPAFIDNLLYLLLEQPN